MEVLRLIKAGFKHAFIDKSDAQELIQAVENWMFAQVANAPGLDWHPAKSPDGVRIVSTDHDPPGAPGNPSV